MICNMYMFLFILKGDHPLVCWWQHKKKVFSSDKPSFYIFLHFAIGWPDISYSKKVMFKIMWIQLKFFFFLYMSSILELYAVLPHQLLARLQVCLAKTTDYGNKDKLLFEANLWNGKIKNSKTCFVFRPSSWKLEKIVVFRRILGDRKKCPDPGCGDLKLFLQKHLFTVLKLSIVRTLVTIVFL